VFRLLLESCVVLIVDSPGLRELSAAESARDGRYNGELSGFLIPLLRHMDGRRSHSRRCFR
jgi:hypothetical protein